MDNMKLVNIFEECRKLSEVKNMAYSDQPLKLFGIKGIVMRMGDKYFRLMNIIMNNDIIKCADNMDIILEKNEMLEDTFKDMINYAAYGLMFLRGDL